MYIRGLIINLANRALSESIPIDVMVRVVKDLLPGYDLYDRTGIPSNIPIQPRDAASQIVRDIVAASFFLPLVEMLIRMNRDGLNGRVYPVPLLGEIAKELAKDGVRYDQSTGLFIEAYGPNSTPNWRRLRPGADSNLTLLRFDIAQHTRLVRSYDPKKIAAAFADFRSMLSDAVTKRNGRLWCSEGGIAAFYYGHRDKEATLAAMEVLHGLFLYNKLTNSLPEPLLVRIAIHNGPCHWAASEDDLQKNEVVRRVKEIESKCTAPGSVTVSPTVYDSFDRVFASWFTAIKGERTHILRSYSVRMEEKA
jgi:class 3 adenylate cyclase